MIRSLIRQHAPVVTGFATMLAIALLMGVSLQASLPVGQASITGLPGPPIGLPTPAQDADLDGYGNDVDRFVGDLHLRIEINGLQGDVRKPYLSVSTQDDQWRLGAGRALEWPHIIDPDPLGHDPGSPAWKAETLRTGIHLHSIPMEGEVRAISDGIPVPGDGVTWPQAFHLNVRDDRASVTATIALHDAGYKPDRHLGQWDITFNLAAGTWNSHPAGAAQRLAAGDAWIDVQVTAVAGLDPATQQELADAWAPTVRFATGERFFPLPGGTLQTFHGFAPQIPDHRTWARDFNNGRDAYQLFLADFNGDRITDHQDAAIMTELLGAGGKAEPTLYAHVARATGDQVIIQYWMLYAYNHVPDDGGTDIEFLTHAGDRELIQLRFASLEEARNGTPLDVAYSQHYKGIRVEGLQRPDIFVAHGSHASFPIAGDDRRLRPAFIAYGDIFDGGGETWTPGNYTVELLTTQPWHAGYKWGPITRHHRILGTANAPLQQHSFEYPFLDPISWHMTRQHVLADDLTTLYGEP